jgi:fermentation-respiration switch protein FrsA (DUF1100 family)
MRKRLFTRFLSPFLLLHLNGLTEAAMKRAALFVLFALTLSGCSASRPDVLIEKPILTGRKLVLQALKPDEKNARFMGKFAGLLTTAISSMQPDLEEPLKSLDPEDQKNQERIFTVELSDGTKVGGLLFKFNDGGKGPKPLLMSSFGFLQDRWGTEVAKFCDLYLKDPQDRIPAHVLFLDHPTSGPFLAYNNLLSMGSYDDARMWIEIAQRLKGEMPISSIHLFGISMSGQTVVHALIEDKRLGLDLFDSGMAFSIAPDFRETPGKQLAQLETPTGIENPWKQGLKDLPPRTLLDEISALGIWILVEEQFIPGYLQVNPNEKNFDIRQNEVPLYFRKAYEDRITFLREQQLSSDTWNHKDFSLENLDLFMATTRIANVIDRVQTPLVLVSARDDPAVAHWMFQEVVQAAKGNPWVVSYETKWGGHFGFDVSYGKDYVGRIIQRMLDPELLRYWLGPAIKDQPPHFLNEFGL